MEDLFLTLFNRSIAAGWLILAVLLLRLALKKAPKAVHCLLWLLVGVRLACPFSIESALSLVPSTQLIQSTADGGSFRVSTGIAAVNSVVNPYLANHYYEGVTVPLGLRERVTQVCAWVWLIGAASLLLYSLASYLLLRRRVSTAVRLRDGLWQSDQIASPFLLGFFRPRIYLPFGMDEAALSYVETHERAHIRRRDHWWKPLGFLILTVYWFNPLVWAAYVLLCRDIELACDEQVIRQLGADSKAAYSQALLNCSVSRSSIAACPLAFGEVGVKQRVKNILNYKRPAFWVLLASLVACTAAAVFFLTDPVDLCRDLYPGDRGFEDHVNYGVADCENPYAALMAALQDAEPLQADDASASYSPDLLDSFTIPDLAQVHDFFTLTANGRTVVDISYQTEDGTEVVVEYEPDGGFYKLVARRPLRLRKQVSYTYAPQGGGDGSTVYTGGALLCQSAALSFLPTDAGDYADVTESGGVLTIRGQDGESIFTGSLEDSKTYTRQEFLALLGTPLLGEPEKLEDMVGQDVEAVVSRVYRQTEPDGDGMRFTILELTEKGGGKRLWLGQGSGGEVPIRIFELLDRSQVFPYQGSGLLWTYSDHLPLLPIRFDEALGAVQVSTDSGCFAAPPAWDSQSYTVPDRADSLTLPPGATLYWAPASGGGLPERVKLSFSCRLEDGTEISDSVELRPVSDQVSLFGFRTCGLSMDWLGLFSSRLHQYCLHTDASNGVCLISPSATIHLGIATAERAIPPLHPTLRGQWDGKAEDAAP